jgi:methionyl-tRNA formyltransferase
MRHVQGLAPFPGAWFEVDGERIKLLAAEVAVAKGPIGAVLDDRMTIACGAGAIRPTLLQRAGKTAMSLDEFLRGFAVPAGTRLA